MIVPMFYLVLTTVSGTVTTIPEPYTSTQCEVAKKAWVNAGHQRVGDCIPAPQRMD